ncbi:hypothetical protein Trydic_g22281 [Trypoxylus dichotomus]
MDSQKTSLTLFDLKRSSIEQNPRETVRCEVELLLFAYGDLDFSPADEGIKLEGYHSIFIGDKGEYCKENKLVNYSPQNCFARSFLKAGSPEESIDLKIKYVTYMHTSSVKKRPRRKTRTEDLPEAVKINIRNAVYSMYSQSKLLTLANQHQTEKKYQVHEILKVKGHTLLRIPPYHCQFDAIELVWVQAKGYYDKIGIIGMDMRTQKPMQCGKKH